jgi:poly(A) polymerase
MRIKLPLDLFKQLASLADELNIECYVIGGYVRDSILGRPSKDLDIMVQGSGIDFAKEFAKRHNIKKVNYFSNFGTAQIVTKDFEVEFVGARKESYDRNSRKPVVENGTLEDDQNRRDFTINALAARLSLDGFGEVTDPFNGLEDLKNGIIRTPLDPGTTFSDDPLRMMRAIRFATQLNYKIEESTLQGIYENAKRLEIISQERITDELNKIVMSPVPSIGFKHLFDTKLLHEFFPEMVALQGVESRNGQTHKDNFYHTLKVLDNVAEESDNLWLRWSAILHDIAKPPTKRFNKKEGWTFHGHEDKGSRMVKPIFRRMRLPLNEKMKYVEKLVLLHLRPIVLSQSKVTDSAVRRLIVDAGEDIDDLLLLCKCDITSKNEQRVKRYVNNLLIVKDKIADVTERDNLRNWQPPITGNHIMENFVIKDPRQIGELKNIIRESILEGEVPNDLEAAYSFMISKGIEMGLEEKQKK